MSNFTESNEQIQLRNIWANAFRAVELAFYSEDIRTNLKEVIKMQINTSPFDDIQLYKFNKRNGQLISSIVIDDKKPLLGLVEYKDVHNEFLNVQDKDGNRKNLSITKFSNQYNNYIMIAESKNKIETTSEMYCEQVIIKTWQLILEKLGYQDKIREAYITDPLTKVGNRAYYAEMTNNIFNEGKKDITYSLVDLFRLKFVNDNFGHKYGDKYIKTAARLVKDKLDVDDNLFRIGGDEFAILSGSNKKKVMIDKFEEVNDILQHVKFGQDIPFPLNINYGVIEGTEDLDTFYSKADARLARQKSKTYKRLNIDRRR